MINISECDKVKLKSGELAKISEVLKKDKDYIAEIFKKDGHVEIDQISYDDIASVFVEIEKPLAM
jgi:hypothetical protein